MIDFEKYEKMCDAGASAKAVYLATEADGLNQIESIKILIQVFKLSLVQAKEITVTSHGEASSLDEYQEKYILPILEKLEPFLDMPLDEDVDLNDLKNGDSEESVG